MDQPTLFIDHCVIVIVRQCNKFLWPDKKLWRHVQIKINLI